ncbi:unnamed protein product [Effrenium voratum]|uniref:Uncharacterized protein n=1 Tax=Effrenium voratum TaxID=2562239 RepID=A0AA36ISF1_9DINO|nr:unnamed protein product [Effrenium voratum]CAJ1437871.1 unnamed protein product [Effrenium voratum]
MCVGTLASLAAFGRGLSSCLPARPTISVDAARGVLLCRCRKCKRGNDQHCASTCALSFHFQAQSLLADWLRSCVTYAEETTNSMFKTKMLKHLRAVLLECTSMACGNDASLVATMSLACT